MIEDNIQALDDARLIERAKQGEVEAFGCLYERYLESIYRYIRTRVAEDRIAEDLTETVFLRSFESLSRYKEKGLRFSAFLYQVARNLLVDHYRQEEEELPIESADQISVSPSRMDDTIVHQDQVDSLRVGLEALPEEYREIIRLRVLLELSTKECAQWIGRSEGVVRVRLHRAMKALKRQVANDDEPQA
ncbi:MAG: sigma-70 family RNA polymerase sigma factor [Anaerolineales bacterium]|nr:MAG: sigma-70 family RNA polymerase sigma factor [Anaerolineales bacterium]